MTSRILADIPQVVKQSSGGSGKPNPKVPDSQSKVLNAGMF